MAQTQGESGFSGRAAIGKNSGKRPAPAKNGKAAYVAAKPPSPAPAAPVADTGGYSSSSWDGGGAAVAAPQPVAAPAPVAPPPPPPMRDVDWFNQDSAYKGAAGRSLTDLTSQLAEILANRDSNFQQLDLTRGDISKGRQEDLTSTGDDFAARGMLQSGLFAQGADRVAADYARQGEEANTLESQLVQQYGNRGNKVDLGGLNANNLNGAYGALGSLGVGAGNNYNSAISKAKAESAARSSQPLIQTTSW